MERLKKFIGSHRKETIGATIILILCVAIAVALGFNTINEANKEATITESSIQLVEEHSTISEEKFGRELIDELTTYVSSGNSGVYTISDRHFVVLTTGGLSDSPIEYKIESTTEGGKVVYYGLTGKPDNEFKLRYVILEFNSPDIQIEKEKGTGINENTNGFTQVLIFDYLEEKKIYGVNQEQLLSGNTWETPGTYMANYVDGQLAECVPIDSVTINECIVDEKITQSKRLYNITIPSGDMIQVYLDDLNLKDNEEIDIEIKFDSVLQGFSGKVLGGM